MKEAFEKIIERLEDVERCLLGEAGDIGCAIGIVNAIERAKDIVDEVAEEYDNDSWIPVSERLPECEDYSETDALLFQLGSGTIEVGYFGKKNAWRDYYFRHYRGIGGVDIKDVIAWQPLPQPYKPKGE